MAISRSNIVLTGMPGSGKSTVGVLLAKSASMDFVDTDVLIQTRQKKSLQEIVNNEGYLALRQIEEKLLLELELSNHVIATGGSAIYSPKAMEYLRKTGAVIFLDADLKTLRNRVTDFSIRGLAKRPGQNLEQLFTERYPLYLKHADLTVSCSKMTQEQVCAEIIQAVSRKTHHSA